jgi:enolase
VDGTLADTTSNILRTRNRHERRAIVAGVSGYTVDQFCERYNFGRSCFYKLLKEGRGPRIMKIGRLTRISPEADDEFRARLEAESGA